MTDSCSDASALLICCIPKSEEAFDAQMGRMPADGDAQLAQRLQEEFNSSSGARPKRTAASEAKKRLAEVLTPSAQLPVTLTPFNQAES